MAQVIYSGSINDELSKTTTARIHEATNEITRTYDAKIAAAQKEIAAAQAKEARLQRQVTNSRFLADCEAGLATCSQTHKLGRGPYYKRDARRAAAAAAELKRARPQIAATIAANRRKIAVWRAAESSQLANRVATIKADRDFLARQAALDRVEKASPAVTKYVEFFLAFLIAIDLVALILKLTHLFSTGGAYERSAAALRATDLVEVHRLQQRANVLTRRITLEAQAEQDADELRIRGEISREPELESDELRLNDRPHEPPPRSAAQPPPLSSATDDRPQRGRSPGTSARCRRHDRRRPKPEYGARELRPVTASVPHWSCYGEEKMRSLARISCPRRVVSSRPASRNERTFMSIVVRFAPTGLTKAKYDSTIEKIEAAEKFPPDGLEYHICFGSDGDLKVSEIWDSQAQLDEFGSG